MKKSKEIFFFAGVFIKFLHPKLYRRCAHRIYSPLSPNSPAVPELVEGPPQLLITNY